MPPTAEAFRVYYNTSPVLWWRGWEKNGFGMTPPEYFPPTEGWDSFVSAVYGAHRKGGRVMVLVPSLLCYSFNASSWQEAVNYAPRDRWGNLYTHTWYIHNNSGIIVKQVGFVMAPTDFWLEKILNITLELARRGIDVIQLDGGPPQPYLNYHGDLPKGGGSWWASRYLEIYRVVREEIRRVNPEVAIGSEWMAETYIPYIDMANDEVVGGLDPVGIGFGIFYNTSLNSYIPLWQAVYHEYMLLFSSILFVDGRDSLYYLRNLALSLVWGEAPMVDADPQGTGRPYNLKLYDLRMLEYSRRIVEARTKYAYHYLVEGVMLRPPRVSPNPRVLIPGAKSIPYTGVDVEPFYSDSLFASAWLAADKSVGAGGTSIWRELLNVTLHLGSYGVLEEGRNYTVYLVVNGEIRRVYSTGSIPREVTLTLAPYDVALVVITPHDSLRSKALLRLQEAISRLELLSVKEEPQVSRILHLATYSFENNDFQRAAFLVDELLENLTKLYHLMEHIRVINNTVMESYDKAATYVLREQLDTAAKDLREAALQARKFNFDIAEKLIRSSEQNLTQFYTLLDQTIKIQSELDQLYQVLAVVNETAVSTEAKQYLMQARDLIREASECINLGRFEEAESLLIEAKRIISEAKSIDEGFQKSQEKLDLAMLSLGIAIVVVLLITLITFSRTKKHRIKRSLIYSM